MIDRLDRRRAPRPLRRTPRPRAGRRLDAGAGRRLLRLGGRDRVAVPDRAGPGLRRRVDQRQPVGGRALRADPRRAQPGRGLDDQDDRAVRRVRRAAAPRRRTPAHPHRGGVGTGRAPRRHRDRPGRAAWPRRSSSGAGISLGVGLLAALADIAGGLPVAGSLAFGASWAGHRPGRDRAHRRRLPALRQRAHLRDDRRRRPRRAVRAARRGGHLGVVAELAARRSGGRPSCGRGRTPGGGCCCCTSPPCVAFVVAAQALRGARDLGSGVLAARPGPATGSPRLADAIALSLRLHTPMVLGWTMAMAALGVVLGSIAPNIGDLLDSPSARDMMERLGGVGALEDTMIAAELSIAAVIISCFGIAVVGPRRRRRAGWTHRAGARHRHLARPAVRRDAGGRPARCDVAAPGHGRRGGSRLRRARPARSSWTGWSLRHSRRLRLSGW